MLDRQLNAIKEIEFRINSVKLQCKNEFKFGDSEEYSERLDNIDNLLFDIDDFINDLKNE